MENNQFRYRGRWDPCEDGIVFFREMDIIDGMISPSAFDTIYSDLNRISELESEKIVIRKVDL
jgi:hypothetical protein